MSRDWRKRCVLLGQQGSSKEELQKEQRVGPALAELRRSFHHWGTRYENSPVCCACTDGFTREGTSKCRYSTFKNILRLQLDVLSSSDELLA